MRQASYPFTVNANDKQAQEQLKGYFDKFAYAEKRDLVSVWVQPIEGQPVPLSAVASALPLISSMRSPYIPHLSEMVRDEAKDMAAAAAAAASGGAGRRSITAPRVP